MLDVVDVKAKQATEVLQESPGVLIVDALEGSPDVIIVNGSTEPRAVSQTDRSGAGLCGNHD